MATWRKLPRAGKLISLSTHTRTAMPSLSPSPPLSLSLSLARSCPRSRPASPLELVDTRATGVGYTSEVADGRAGVVPRLEMRIQSQVYSPVAAG